MVLFQNLFQGYIFCFLGDSFGRCIFEQYAYETNLKKKRSVSMSRLSGKASTKLGLTLNLKFELCGTIDNRPKSVTVCQGCQVNKASIKIRFDLMTLHYVAQLTRGPTVPQYVKAVS